jgi:hypothetical protein
MPPPAERPPQRAGAASPAGRYIRETSRYQTVLKLDDADLGYSYAFRFWGQNVRWRVVLGGVAGDEVLFTHTIPAGTPATDRATGLPEVLAGSVLRVEAQLLAAGDPVEVRAEAGWLPVYPQGGPR